MIDFDKLYSDFLKDWYVEETKKGTSALKMEEMLPLMYGVWLETPNAEGKTPLQIVSALSETELGEHFMHFADKETDPPMVICDEIVARRLDGMLAKLLGDSGVEENFRILCGNMLAEMDSDLGFSEYIEWIFDEEMSEELRGFAAQCLEQRTDCAEILLARLPKQGKAREYVADILHRYQNEKVFKLLVDLFLSEDNAALYSAYLAAQGDERAVEVLKKYAETCSFVDFLEVRNAVEALGGEIDFERDFSQDPYFIKLMKKNK